MAEKLKKYNKKRDFEKTSEPEGDSDIGQSEKVKDKLHFVVQHHMASREHYDLRLEWGGVMLSWAVPKGPSFLPSDKRLAIHVEDHPLEYRHFEGTIPKGEYGGGTVMIWDEGYYEPYSDMGAGLKKGSLKFTLEGSRLKGRWALVRLKKDDDSDKEQNNWLLIKDKDEYSGDSAGISDYTLSITTGRTMAEIEAGAQPAKNIGAKKVTGTKKSRKKSAPNPFKTTGIQLAKLVNAVPDGKNWLYEFKYDGYRIISYIEDNKARLQTRNDHDYSDRFLSVTESLISLANGRSLVLDGEMAVTDETGRTDFQALQNYLKNPTGKDLVYIAFDLLALDGVDLRNQPLIRRKEKLESLLKDAPENIHYSRHVQDTKGTNAGEESLAIATKLKMEGIIGKMADSIYTGTRSNEWIKIKCDRRQEFVIGGYTISEKSIRGVSSLLLGYYEDGNLIYAGRTGTGFTEQSAKELLTKFNSLKRKTTPFQTAPKERTDENIVWLRPSLVAEIKFAEWTKENQLRQASFKGIRIDKEAKEVRREVAAEADVKKTEGGGKAGVKKTENDGKEKVMDKTGITVQDIKISNPDKVIFEDPEITKIDVIRYYEQVAEKMLPYVEGRILSIVRCPKGVEGGACFYKKHPEPGRHGIFTVEIPASNEKGKKVPPGNETSKDDYFYIKDITGLISETQMGTLEFHSWGSKAMKMENPDLVVFDLDPDEGMDLKTIRLGVKDLRAILNELSLNAYLKTSGGKGYHVVVPIKPVATWDKVKEFAKSVVQVMESKWPDRYTSNSRKIKRSGKIMLIGNGMAGAQPVSHPTRLGQGRGRRFQCQLHGMN